MENVETGKNGGSGGGGGRKKGGKAEDLLLSYIFKIGRTFRPQKCPAGPASTSFVGKPSLFPRRSAGCGRVARRRRGRAVGAGGRQEEEEEKGEREGDDDDDDKELPD